MLSSCMALFPKPPHRIDILPEPIAVEGESPVTVERYCRKPFPAYRFVPGETPHPTRDPQGHSFGVQEAVLDKFDVDNWLDCEPYLYGVDLFNHGYWWEAHEAWEIVWKCVGRRTRTGLFLQGLIQISVALLKTKQGLSNAAGRLLGDGITKLTIAKDIYLGVDVSALVADARAHVSSNLPSAPVIRLVTSRSPTVLRE